MKALLKTGETIEIIPNDDFCAAKYINKETSEYVFNDEIVEIINEEIAAKYIDADLLRKEIERLKENIISKVHHYPIHRIDLLDDLLAFLDTLESEKPSEGLEEEIERCLSTEWELDEDLNKDESIYLYGCTLEDLKILARHFAQWGAEHLKK